MTRNSSGDGRNESSDARRARRIVALASFLVPRHRRASWLEEWEAEIWHYERQAGAGSRGPGLTARSLGAFRHALEIRMQQWSPDMIRQDIRYAFRRFFRSPGFTSVALLTIALGIGANVAIFSLVDSVVLAPLPYPEPDELTAVWEWHKPRDHHRNVVNPGNFNVWDREAAAFEEMAGVVTRSLVLTGSGDPEEVQAQLTTDDYFQVLGIDAAVGRVYGPDDDLANQPVVLAHDFWMNKFGGDPEVVGRTLTLNGSSATVVGVLDDVFMPFGDDTQLWATIPVDVASITPDQTGRSMMVVARLADGGTVERANSELQALAERLEEQYPEIDQGWSVEVFPLQDDVVGEVRPALLVLLASVGLLLLVACGNVANLLLARSATRKREMAVRTSLGASGSDLARQLLTESLILAGVGALLGIAVAYFGLAAGASALPRAFPLPRMAEVAVNGRVLLFATGATLLTGLLFGTVPALQAARVSPAEALGSGSRGNAGDHGSARLRRALIVAEVALSLVLLVGAGLLARSFQKLTSVDSGMNVSGVLTAGVNLSTAEYRDPAARASFFDETLQRLEAVPGVEAAGMTNFLPLDGPGAATAYWPMDRAKPSPDELTPTKIRPVAGDYFRAMGIPVLQGRAFDSRDRADSPPVAVVSRALAEDQWPGQEPVGKRLSFEWGQDPVVEVVGVVGDVRLNGLDTPSGATLYLPYAQLPSFPFATLVARTDGDPRGLARQLEATVRDMDPALPVTDIRVMEDVLSASVARPRVTALLMGVFAAVALTLAAVGLYGVLSYVVSRRQAEMGIRMALGAGSGELVAMILKEGLILAVAGLTVGLVAAFLGSGLLESLLFGVEAGDPAVYAVVAATLLAVSVVACLAPALRAARVEPARSLREE